MVVDMYANICLRINLTKYSVKYINVETKLKKAMKKHEFDIMKLYMSNLDLI